MRSINKGAGTKVTAPPVELVTTSLSTVSLTMWAEPAGILTSYDAPDDEKAALGD